MPKRGWEKEKNAPRSTGVWGVTPFFGESGAREKGVAKSGVIVFMRFPVHSIRPNFGDGGASLVYIVPLGGKTVGGKKA